MKLLKLNRNLFSENLFLRLNILNITNLDLNNRP